MPDPQPIAIGPPPRPLERHRRGSGRRRPGPDRACLLPRPRSPSPPQASRSLGGILVAFSQALVDEVLLRVSWSQGVVVDIWVAECPQRAGFPLAVLVAALVQWSLPARRNGPRTASWIATSATSWRPSRRPRLSACSITRRASCRPREPCCRADRPGRAAVESPGLRGSAPGGALAPPGARFGAGTTPSSGGKKVQARKTARKSRFSHRDTPALGADCP